MPLISVFIRSTNSFFLFPFSWALVTGFVFFTLSVEEYTERFIDWIKELKK